MTITFAPDSAEQNNEKGVQFSSRFRQMNLEYIPSHARFILVKWARGKRVRLNSEAGDSHGGAG